MGDPSPGFSISGATGSGRFRPAPPADPPATAAPKELPAGFYWNLLMLIAFGVLSCAWVLHYSDWFETVGGLLALGGAFSWLAFVSRALPEDAMKQMQREFARILGGKFATRVILAAFLAFLAGVSFLGSVSVEPRQDGFGHYLYIYPEGGALGEPLGLTSGQPTRFVRPAVPILGSAHRIKVPGLPSKRARFVPWLLGPVYIPHYFDRKVFLVRPDADAALVLKNNPATIRLTVHGSSNHSEEAKNYTGYSFWLNCASDVIVPPATLIEIGYAIPKEHADALKSLWLTPRRLEGVTWDDLDLRDGDTIGIDELVEKNRVMDFGEGKWTVKESHSYEEAVEILVLTSKGG